MHQNIHYKIIENTTMAKIKKGLQKIVGSTERYIDKLRYSKNPQSDLLPDDVEIVPYRGYGTANSVFLKGRLLKDKDIQSAPKDSTWKNIRNTYKRFESDELPHTNLQIMYAGKTYDLVSDHEGFFSLNIELDETLKVLPNWNKAMFNITANRSFVDEPPVFGEVLLPPNDAEFGIISDLDDTVIKSNVHSTTRMLYETFVKNAWSRMAFKGVADWYGALCKGSTGKANNPIFYVSNGPWNLYDLHVEFMQLRNIPKGPIMLRDFGLANNPMELVAWKQHKYREVARILRTYPHLPFILIGDSSEKDALIYREIARTFPGRIIAVFIRALDKNKKNLKKARKLAEKEESVDIALFKNSLKGAKLSLKNDFITQEAYLAFEQKMAEGKKKK